MTETTLWDRMSTHRRRSAVLAAHAQGETMGAIARRYGIKRKRVERIIHAHPAPAPRYTPELISWGTRHSADWRFELAQWQSDPTTDPAWLAREERLLAEHDRWLRAARVAVRAKEA